MFPELTNLLPRSSIKALRGRYFLRVATVGIALLILIVLIHGALLIPSYLYAREEINTENAQLQKTAATLSIADEKKAQTQLTTLQSESTYLATLRSAPSASAAIRMILAVPHAGVTLSGFTYTPPTKGTSGSMQISGTASTRDTLRNYDQVLTALPNITNVDLPIGDYAQQSKIPFTITLTGTFTP